MSGFIFFRSVGQFFLDILLVPVWWYTHGFLWYAYHLWQKFLFFKKKLSPGLWLINLFVPMFGQTDWQGRIMSVFVRMANVMIRAFLLSIVAIIFLVCLSFWPLLPALTVYFLWL